MEILRSHAAVVEEASVDEAYADLSFSLSYESAEAIALAIKNEIKEKEHLTASVGIGPNKLIAKIASDCGKPDGFTVVREEDAEEFLAPLPIRTIPGVGPKMEEKFRKFGMQTVRDAKRFGAEELKTMLGKFGTELYEKLRGRSDAGLVTEWEQKSIGEQTTFAHDVFASDSLKDRKLLEDMLAGLAEDVIQRLKAGGFESFKTIAITVRFSDFTTVSRAVTLPKPVAGADPAAALQTLQFQALRLFMPFLDRRENPEKKAIRLLGVRVEKLE